MGRLLVLLTVALQLAAVRPRPIGGLTPARGMSFTLIRRTHAPDAGVRVQKENPRRKRGFSPNDLPGPTVAN